MWRSGIAACCLAALLAACDKKATGPAQTGGWIHVTTRYAPVPANSHEAESVSHAVATVYSGTEVLSRLDLTQRLGTWSGTTATPLEAGQYTVSVSAFEGERLARAGDTTLSVTPGDTLDVEVALRWTGPWRLRAELGAGWLSLRWNFVLDRATWVGFAVLRQDEPSGEFAPVGPQTDSPTSFPSYSRSYLDLSVEPEKAYSYLVAAVDMAGRLGAYSDTLAVLLPPDTVPPRPPTGVVAHFYEQPTPCVTVYWEPPVMEADNKPLRELGGYVLQREIGSTGQSTTLSLSAGEVAYRDTDVVEREVYTYRVAALDKRGNVSDTRPTSAVWIPPALRPLSDLASALEGALADGPLAYALDGHTYVMDQGDGSGYPVGPGAPIAWSPDGTLLVIQDDGDSPYTVDVATGQVTELPSQSLFRGWSPDGSQILLYLEHRGEVWVQSGRASDARCLADGWPHGWMPTGEILYSREPDHCCGPMDPLLILDPDTGEAIEPARGRAPVPSPDGKWLAYNTGLADAYALYVLRLDGSDHRRVAAPHRDRLDKAWSPDGSMVLYGGHTRWDSYIGVQVYWLAGAEAAVGPGYAPRWSPDGRTISHIEWLPPRQFILDTASVDDLQPVRWTLIAGESHTWSPDSRLIAFEANGPHGGDEIRVLDVTSGATAVLAVGNSPLWAPAR